MNILLVIQILAAVQLLFGAVSLTTRTFLAAMVHQFIPSILAAGLGFFSLAQFMGWPV